MNISLLKNVNGTFGVLLFFLLSGFLMGNIYLEKPCTSANILHFVIARLSRVMPLYIVGLLVYAYDSGNLQAILPGIFLLRAPQHLWTVPVEMQFYAVFLTIWMSRQHSYAQKLFEFCFHLYYTLALVKYVCGSKSDDLFTPLPSVFTGTTCCCGNESVCLLSYLPIFITGTYLGQHWARVVLPFEHFLQLLVPFLLVGMALNTFPQRWSINSYFEGYYDGPPRGEPGGTTVVWAFGEYFAYSFVFLDPLSLFLAVAVIACASVSAPALCFLNSRPADFFGKISFGLYVTHWQILHLFSKLIDDKYVSFAEGVCVTIIVSWFSFRYFEDPISTYARRKVTRCSNISGMQTTIL